MFTKMLKKNSRSSRKDNSIFFTSLVVAVIAFYIILSLENQDVMRFLKTMESDAITRLTGMIPIFYGLSLFLIFFLIYFAGKFQMERRSHEFGIYLTLGMQKSRLFLMLAGEDVLNSIMALAIGLPCAVFLSEIISLVTAKAVGLGIIGHRFTFSVKAAVLTGAGFLGVKLLAFLVLSGKTAGQEICVLMKERQEEKQDFKKKRYQPLYFLLGLFLLAAAYAMAIVGDAWNDTVNMGITVLAGTVGTFLIFRGLGRGAEKILSHRKNRKGLFVFTFRQLQEHVFLRYKVMAVSSLLILMALVCFGFGYGVSGERTGNGDFSHAADFTFEGDGADIRSRLEEPGAASYVGELFEVKTAMLFSEKDADVTADEKEVYEFDTELLNEKADQLKESRGKELLLNHLQYFSSPYVIALSGYNKVLELKGKEPIELGENEVALYSDEDMTPASFKEAAEEVLRENPELGIDDQNYRLAGKLYSDNFVADRMISIDMGLIVDDSTFQALFEEDETAYDGSYWNVVLPKELIEEKGLMQASMEAEEVFGESGLRYESYLKTVGRQLFYVVASTYITLYLALIFLIIANTVLAVQFLIQQQKTKGRYQTLLRLGADYEGICRSARTQIKWYFAMAVSVAGISSIFGIASLLKGMVPGGLEDKVQAIFGIAVLTVCILCIIEYIYMHMVMKKSDKYLLELINQEQK